MSAHYAIAAAAAPSPMSAFERYLSVWVALCIVAGIALGYAFPGVFQALARLEYGSVNFVVGVLIWFVNIIYAFAAGKKAEGNPWGEGATTLEWTLSSPPPYHQFETLPVIDDNAHH